jgi:hypothetical protein
MLAALLLAVLKAETHLLDPMLTVAYDKQEDTVEILFAAADKLVIAQHQPEQADAPAAPDAVEPKEGAAEQEAAEQSEPALPNRSAPKEFTPTEKIPADQAVDFPADI